MEVMMLDLMFLLDQNKLSQLTSLQNILTKVKNKFKKMLRLEFQEFQEFLKLHHKQSQLQSQKL